MLSIKVGNLAVDLYQPETKKHSYPLLLIHGAGGTSRYLRNYLLFLSGAGWLCYAVNLRGHYPSDPEAVLAQVTIEDYVADVERVMTVLGIEDCALIGHSMGGLIAQRAAMLFQSSRALVTIASAPPAGVALEIKSDLPYPEAIINSMWGLFNLQPVEFTYFLTEKTVLNNIEDEEKMNVYPMFVAESLMAGYQVAQGVFVDPEQITCPKLVIGCRRDLMASESMQHNLADFLKADYISYRQFAHLPMLEKGWEKSASDIAEWLTSNVRE